MTAVSGVDTTLDSQCDAAAIAKTTLSFRAICQSGSDEKSLTVCLTSDRSLDCLLLNLLFGGAPILQFRIDGRSKLQLTKTMKLGKNGPAITLLAFICLALISIGISGGPVYGTGSNVTVTGNYAGVLSPQPCSSATPAATPTASATPVPGRCGANSIGIFNISAPKSGATTGPVVVFNEGQAYVGTIQGSADSVHAKITGLIHGTFSFTEQVVTSTEDTTDPNGTIHHKVNYATQTFAAQAVGQMSAKARSVTVGTNSSVRLKGHANVQFSLDVNDVFDEVAYVVSGSKQSEAQ
jgi:hypothetical protein